MTAVDGNIVTGVQGGSITLNFTTSNALPAITAENIQWFFKSTNDSQIELTQSSQHNFSSDRLSLTISPLVLSDEGNYTLQINHITGSVISAVFLELHSKY